MWGVAFPCRRKFGNRAWLGGTAKRANASRQFSPRCCARCCAHSTHPKWTRPSAERRRPNQLCVTPGRSGRNGFHLANSSSGPSSAAVAAWAGSARGRRRLAGAASGAPGSGGRSRLAGAAAEPTSLAGALADSLEGVAAEACAAGARVGVWTCAAGISPRSGGRGLSSGRRRRGRGVRLAPWPKTKIDWAKPAVQGGGHPRAPPHPAGQARSGKTTFAACHAPPFYVRIPTTPNIERPPP